MQDRYNLIDEKWIPVEGSIKASMLDVFSNNTNSSLGGTAVQKLAVLRFLIAIAERACPLKNEKDWAKIGSDGLGKACIEYLDKYRDCFFLYGKKPFLQMPQLKGNEEAESSVINYVYLPDVIPVNNNDSIFRIKQKQDKVEDADKAVYVLTLMGYALGGKRVSLKKRPGLSPNYIKGGSAKSGPFLGNYNGYLNSFVIGKSILETVWLNYLTDDDLIDLGKKPLAEQPSPPWEEMPKGEEDEIAESLKTSVWSYWVPISRFILLDDIGIKYVEGLTYPSSVKEGWIDPFMAINRQHKTIYVDTGKKPWRSVTALLETVYQTNSSKESFDCMILRIGITRLIDNADMVPSFGIWSGGLQVRGNSGDQSVKQDDDFVSSSIYFDTSLMKLSAYIKICDFMKTLSEYEISLKKSIDRYYKVFKIDSKGIAGNAAYDYWQKCERYFQELINACQNKKDTSDLIKNIQNELLKIYDNYCAKGTARQLMAWTKNRPVFKEVTSESK